MDSNNNSQICPWCQTEIVWDPEFGPEETCPHCLNELKGYRTVKLKLRQSGEDLSLEEEDEDEEDPEAFDDLDDDADLELDDLDELDDSLDADDLLDDYTVEGARDPYAEQVIAVMDTQDFAPECSNCHELMLHAGLRHGGGSDFEPKVPQLLGVPVLKGPFTMNVFVCPACFKTDEYLTKESQEQLIKSFSPDVSS